MIGCVQMFATFGRGNRPVYLIPELWQSHARGPLIVRLQVNDGLGHVQPRGMVEVSALAILAAT